jgi:hypothetical protein
MADMGVAEVLELQAPVKEDPADQAEVPAEEFLHQQISLVDQVYRVKGLLVDPVAPRRPVLAEGLAVLDLLELLLVHLVEQEQFGHILELLMRQEEDGAVIRLVL